MSKVAISEPAYARINKQLMEVHEVVDVTVICVCALLRKEVEQHVKVGAFGHWKPLCAEARAPTRHLPAMIPCLQARTLKPVGK